MNSSSDQPVDIRALAQEVAAVLYQNPANKDYPPQGQMSVQNNIDDADTVYARSSTITHQPPPNYRAATGPSVSPSTVGSPGKV
jgi:hypothetical protein